jgi:putative transposase
MPRPPRSAESGMIYHVLNRANGREKIFKKQKDFEAFQDILLEAKEKYPMRILSFCLMPNHWHLVLRPHEGRDLSVFMRWVTHTHTQRYNAHYGLIGRGHVYQSRYKSFPVNSDSYFLKVCRYVERNPLRARLVKSVYDWKWSSFWIREDKNEKYKKLLSKWPVATLKNYREWVNEAQVNEDEELERIRNSVNRNCPFGENSWVRKISHKLGLESTLKPIGRPRKGT